MSNKVLVITGASRGIGFATAQLFMEAGYKVVNLSRSEPGLTGIVHIPLDMSSSATIVLARVTFKHS